MKCELCGEFTITGTLLAIGFPEGNLRPYIRAHTRQANERGEIVTLNTDNWKDFAVAHQSTPVSTKAKKLLNLIAARSKPGHLTKVDDKTDPPLVDALDAGELSFLVEHLDELGYVKHAGGWNTVVKAKGWEALQSGIAGAGSPGKCFVAMSFDASLKDVYDSGIFLAVKSDCKMEPVRIDRVHHNEKICDKIVAEIRTCQFVVADVTLQRAGVYFEAGFAMGLGRPVIWSCRQDDLTNVHFDTRQYNHIVWAQPSDLRIQLADRIKATIQGAV